MFNFSIYGIILLALDVMIRSLWATYELHAKITTNSLTTNYWFVVCIFFLFSRFHQISFVFTNGWVFYWVTLSSIYRMVLVFVIFSVLFIFVSIIWNEMIAKAWHKMPLAKSKLLVKVCQQNAIRFQFAVFFVLLSMALRLNCMHSTLLPIYNYRSHFCDTQLKLDCMQT